MVVTPTQKRKQREFEARHQLILDAAKELLKDHSPRQITISLIADKIEYSKGTIYQHFSCKEEIFHHLAKLCASDLLRLVKMARNHGSGPRETMTLSVDAYHVYSLLHASELEHMPTIRSPAFVDKVPQAQRQALEQLEIAVMDEIVAVINAAVEVGDLKLINNITPADVAAGCWSMLYGAYTLLSSWDMSHLGLENIRATVRKSVQVYLDGLGWKPLTEAWDVDAIYTLGQKVYAEELELMSEIRDTE